MKRKEPFRVGLNETTVAIVAIVGGIVVAGIMFYADAQYYEAETTLHIERLRADLERTENIVTELRIQVSFMASRLMMGLPQ